MRVFRRRPTLGLFALLALAAQALVAFAHTHVHVVPSVRAESLAMRAITYGMCRIGSERPCPPPAHHDDHAKCPICWSMSLAAAAVLEAPPAIAVPQLPVRTLSTVRAAGALHAGETVHFQPRAPPSQLGT
jgi:hypothetical protein